MAWARVRNRAGMADKPSRSDEPEAGGGEGGMWREVEGGREVEGDSDPNRREVEGERCIPPPPSVTDVVTDRDRRRRRPLA